MFRHLIKNFGRQIYISEQVRSHCCNSLFLKLKLPPFRTEKYLQQTTIIIRNLTSISKSSDLEPNPFNNINYVLNESEFLEPKFKIKKNDVAEQLKIHYRLSDNQISEIFQSNLKFKEDSLTDLPQILKILLKFCVSKSTLVENPWILTMKPSLLQSKIDVLLLLKMRDFNDLFPFLKISLNRLQRLVIFLKKDAELLPKNVEHRIYYISDKLKSDIKVVSKYLVSRLFVLQMPLESLQENLNNMIKYGVEPMSILKDLWAFRYTPKSVEARLERAKVAKKDKIMPWMVRCPERILERSLKISIDEKELLGDHSSVIQYVSERLGFNEEITRAIMLRHPAVFKVRVTKIKEILDYLLLEEKFSPYDVAKVPRILCHSLQTTRNRFEELKSLGCRPSSLVIVCRSIREYEKFVRSWMAVKERMKSKVG